VTREELVAEVKRISMGGQMPTQAAFNASKPAVWPTATALLMRFDMSWQQLADECGLAWDRRQGRVTSVI